MNKNLPKEMAIKSNELGFEFDKNSKLLNHPLTADIEH